MNLGAMMLFVPDLVEARRFYCDTLGFSLVAASDRHLEFGHDGARFFAFKCERDGAGSAYGREARSVFVFSVSDIAESMRQLRAKGVAFLHETPAENAMARYAAFRDPFGNIHEIAEWL